MIWAERSNYRDVAAGGYKNEASDYRMDASNIWTANWAPRLLLARFPAGVRDVSGGLRRGDDYRVMENGTEEILEWKTWMAGFSAYRGRAEAGWEFGYGGNEILAKMQVIDEESDRPRFLAKAWTAAEPPSDMVSVWADRPKGAFLIDLPEVDFYNKAKFVHPKRMNNRRGGNPATLEMKVSIYHSAVTDLLPSAPAAVAAQVAEPWQGGLF